MSLKTLPRNWGPQRGGNSLNSAPNVLMTNNAFSLLEQIVRLGYSASMHCNTRAGIVPATGLNRPISSHYASQPNL